MARKVNMTVVTIVVDVIKGVHIHRIMVCMMIVIYRGWHVVRVGTSHFGHLE